MTIEENLTEKTKPLFDFLKSQGYNIELEVRPDPKLKDFWGVIPTYKIITGNNLVNEAAFTHELLHIKLFTSSFKGYQLILNDLRFFSSEFFLNINNDLAHFKMVGDFERLGFDKTIFFGTSLEAQLDDVTQYVESIITDFNNANRAITLKEVEKIVCAYAQTRLLEQFFSMDTSTIEKKLCLLDNTLFNICKEEFTNWIAQTDADNMVFYKSLKANLLKNQYFP